MGVPPKSEQEPPPRFPPSAFPLLHLPLGKVCTCMCICMCVFFVCGRFSDVPTSRTTGRFIDAPPSSTSLDVSPLQHVSVTSPPTTREITNYKVYSSSETPPLTLEMSARRLNYHIKLKTLGLVTNRYEEFHLHRELKGYSEWAEPTPCHFSHANNPCMIMPVNMVVPVSFAACFVAR